MKICQAAAIFLALSALPAWADSRDLAIDRMSRCYGLADTRQYLECAYGALQPLRAELGLPPAPQAESFAATFARPAPASVAPVPAPLIRPQAASNQGSTPGFFGRMIGIESRRVAPEQFGLPNARPGPGVNVSQITARIKEYSLDRDGRFTAILENGQVWRQQGGEGSGWKRPASSYQVTVSNGASGSFNLTVAGERRIYKVERIR
jgi:hypothetical protein